MILNLKKFDVKCVFISLGLRIMVDYVWGIIVNF